MSASQFLPLLVEHLRSASTGALEWQDEKRRRVFHLSGGSFLQLQSNLKSESPERLQERTPGLDGAALKAQVREARLRGVLGESKGEVRWHAGLTPPQPDPAPAAELLFAVATLLPPLPPTLRPVSLPQHAQRLQGLPAAALTQLASLDGTRGLEDILDFSPIDPSVLQAAMQVALALGALEDGGDRFGVTLSTQSNSTGLAAADIASLIAEEIGGEAAPVSSAAASAPPPPPSAASVFGPLYDRILSAQSHFEVLGVRWEDAPDVMRKAYFALARDLHPDRYSSQSGEVQSLAEQLFDRVRAAWEVLGDDTKREAYIAKVIRGEKTEEEKAQEKLATILEAEAEFKRGLSEFNSGRIPAAHACFSKAASLVSEEPEFQAYAGYTTFRMFFGKDEGQAEAGANRLRDALRANEKLDSAYVLLGLVNRAKGNDEAARAAFLQALRIKPANVEAAREMKRMQAAKKEAEEKKEGVGGFLSRLFGKK